MKWVVLCYCSLSRLKLWSVTFIKVIWDQMPSFEVTNSFFFLLIIHEWKALQTQEWSHCVRLVKTHRLICNMTYLGQHVTSRDLDLRSNFDLTLQGHQVHVSTRLDERNTMVLELSRSMLSSKVIRKKNFFCQKGYFGVLNYWSLRVIRNPKTSQFSHYRHVWGQSR